MDRPGGQSTTVIDTARQALKSEKILAGDGWRAGAVLHRRGKIVGIVAADAIPRDAQVEDAGHFAVLPGLVDTHVHINEPGRTEWEGFSTATQAAAAGGITTLVDMPLNCIPVTTSLAALETKLKGLQDKLWVDCGFHGGVVPGNAAELEPMVRAGVKSFKAFMIDSGIAEFGWAKESDLAAAMPVLARLGATLLVHAEVDDRGGATYGDQAQAADPQSYRAFLASRPCAMENRAIELIVRLAKQTGCAVHIVHLSSAEALPLIRDAKRAGVKLTAETCPHYLTLSAEKIPDGDGRFKCMPPIRERQNCQALWRGLRDGDIDFIVSDHSPCTPALKKLESHDLAGAWGGISSLQLGLPLIWTAMREHQLPLTLAGRWLSAAPARLVGLASRKGRIEAGFDADFVVFDPDATFTVAKGMIRHRHKETPYEGRRCDGVVRATWLRGTKIFADGRFLGTPSGETLL
jgi:allantoinase